MCHDQDCRKKISASISFFKFVMKRCPNATVKVLFISVLVVTAKSNTYHGSVRGSGGLNSVSNSAPRWCNAAGCALLQLRPVRTGPRCLCRLLYGPLYVLVFQWIGGGGGGAEVLCLTLSLSSFFL